MIVKGNILNRKMVQLKWTKPQGKMKFTLTTFRKKLFIHSNRDVQITFHPTNGRVIH